MLGYPEFHHDMLYKYVSLFGSLFSDLEVFRQGTTEDERVRVPLNFASVQKVLAFAEKQFDSDQMAIATITPRISFDLENILYDPSRKLPKYNQQVLADGTAIRTPLPYNILFQVNVLAKTERDATRIVEQILPHFDPTLALTMYPFSGDTTVSHDVKVTLLNVNRNNDYEGVAEQRQMVIWTLGFELQGWLYGPKKTDGKIIKKISINYNDADDLKELANTEITPGVDDQGNPTTDPLNTIDYTLVDEDDNWDFIIEHGTSNG